MSIFPGCGLVGSARETMRIGQYMDYTEAKGYEMFIVIY
jgi:hypothetical protein